MSLDERFEAAAVKLKAFTKKPTDEELLEVYSLFKQATFGDNNTAKPSMLDLKAKAKWQVWSDKAGLSSNDAKEAYIKKVDEIAPKYS